MSKPHGFSVDTLQEFLEATAQTNEDLIRSNDSQLPFFTSERASAFILGLCARFNLLAEVKFLSVAIFDKYMSAAVAELRQDMANDPGADWAPHLRKLRSQMVLRVLTSIQLASKVCSSSQVVNLNS